LHNLTSLNLKQNHSLFSQHAENNKTAIQFPHLRILNVSGGDVVSIPFEKSFGALTDLNLSHVRNLDSFLFDRVASANSLLSSLNLSHVRSANENSDEYEEGEETDEEEVEEEEEEDGSVSEQEELPVKPVATPLLPNMKELFPTLSFKSLKCLTALDLSSNTLVNNKSLLTVTANARLLKLNLSRNKIITNATLCAITTLQQLNLSHNRLIDDSQMEKLTALTVLDVSYCSKFTCDGVRKLQKLVKLTYSSRKRIAPEQFPHLDLNRVVREDL
jgi:Leucine-rich repeat (LRR) protein